MRHPRFLHCRDRRDRTSTLSQLDRLSDVHWEIFAIAGKNNNNNNNGCVQSDMKIYLHVPLDVPSTENTSGRDGRQQRKYLHKRKGQTKSYVQKERELVDRKRKQSACWGCHQAVSLGVERRRD